MKRARFLQQQATARARPILSALRVRAVERCFEFGHVLGEWSHAKRKFGTHAEKTYCLGCGEMIVVSPYHNHSRQHMQVPAISGEALFNRCASISSETH